MPLVDQPISDALAHQVRADRPAAQAVPLEQFALAPDVAIIFECSIDLEVIAPTGQFQAIVAPTFRPFSQLLKGEIGPLSGEERYWTRHTRSSSAMF